MLLKRLPGICLIIFATYCKYYSPLLKCFGPILYLSKSFSNTQISYLYIINAVVTYYTTPQGIVQIKYQAFFCSAYKCFYNLYTVSCQHNGKIKSKNCISTYI